MKLKELKTMIAEEYRYWLAEQPVDAPETPNAPGVEVGPNDINVMGGGDDSEATLRQIFDMLKAYFEGTPADAPAEMPVGDDMDAGDDMGDMDMDDDGAADAEDEDEDEDEDKEALQERFKKLANIIKG